MILRRITFSQDTPDEVYAIIVAEAVQMGVFYEGGGNADKWITLQFDEEDAVEIWCTIYDVPIEKLVKISNTIH